MPRAKRVKQIWPVALSISAASTSLQLPIRVIREAVYKYGLEARDVHGRIRIPTEALVIWLRTFPRATLSKRRLKQ